MARFSLRHLLGPRLPLRLRVCDACGGDCLRPIAWEPEDDPMWRVLLRCTACEHEHSAVVAPTARTLITRLDEQRMTRWADAFTVALEQGLIDASDFATVRR